MAESNTRDTLPDLLATAADRQASDLHLTPGRPPLVRACGDLVELAGHSTLTPGDIERLVSPHLTDAQRRRFEETSELDCSIGFEAVARVRGNLFRQRGSIVAVFRLIPDAVPRFETLGLPATVMGLARLPRGLVLVTGPTGGGKTTTLAAMVDTINANRRCHILTIEDPIEYVHDHKLGVVNQREVHGDTASFRSALRAALREDPDVVLIGEMRDLDTVEAALRIAETGHLTLATLHTNSAVQTMHRIIDFFPAHQQPQIRAQVSLVLQGVVCQVLVPRADGAGRVPAVEVLVPTTAVRHLIREDKLHQLYSSMQAAPDTVGMQTMNQSLAGHCRRGTITCERARAFSSDPDELDEMVTRPAGAGRVARRSATALGTGSGRPSRRPA